MTTKKPKLIAKVRSLAELYVLARDGNEYERLAIVAARNLGGPDDATLRQALRWLDVNAMETGERGVVGEINFCRDLIDVK